MPALEPLDIPRAPGQRNEQQLRHASVKTSKAGFLRSAAHTIVTKVALDPPTCDTRRGEGAAAGV